MEPLSQLAGYGKARQLVDHLSSAENERKCSMLMVCGLTLADRLAFPILIEFDVQGNCFSAAHSLS